MVFRQKNDVFRIFMSKKWTGIWILLFRGLCPRSPANSPHASRFRRYGMLFLRSQQPKHIHIYARNKNKAYPFIRGGQNETCSFVRGEQERDILICTQGTRTRHIRLSVGNKTKHARLHAGDKDAKFFILKFCHPAIAGP